MCTIHPACASKCICALLPDVAAGAYERNRAREHAQSEWCTFQDLCTPIHNIHMCKSAYTCIILLAPPASCCLRVTRVLKVIARAHGRCFLFLDDDDDDDARTSKMYRWFGMLACLCSLRVLAFMCAAVFSVFVVRIRTLACANILQAHARLRRFIQHTYNKRCAYARALCSSCLLL